MPLIESWADEDDRAVARVRLNAPPGNLLTDAMVAELRAALRSAEPEARLVVLDAAGSHFGYGADVAEHAPGTIEKVLPRFHALVRELHALPCATVAVVRGRCFGGSLELAACCDVMVASPDATFALPEVRLATFAPVASVLLPGRLRDGAARDLLISGRTVDAEWALREGLVQLVAKDPEQAAFDWARPVLSGSGWGLSHALRQARAPALARLQQLDAVERAYFDCARHPDAEEGVRAFLEKRRPRWS